MPTTSTLLFEGTQFGEGPRWRDHRLWFSDFYARAVKSISLAGDLRVEFELDDQPSGLGWMPDGSLLVVSMTRRCVLRRAPSGETTVHADLAGIATFHCNDMVVDAHGRAYVGNFGFDLHAAFVSRGRDSVVADHPTTKLALIAPDGAASVAADDLHFPNGAVITPDGGTLIVGETLARRLTAFDILPDGALGRRRVWASIAPRSPDGIALDASGAIWVANPTAPECVRIAEGGEVLDAVATSQNCYACMLGGDDGKTLFMLTAPTSLPGHLKGAARGRIETATVAVPHSGLP